MPAEIYIGNLTIYKSLSHVYTSYDIRSRYVCAETLIDVSKTPNIRKKMSISLIARTWNYPLAQPVERCVRKPDAFAPTRVGCIRLFITQSNIFMSNITNEESNTQSATTCIQRKTCMRMYE